MIIKKEKWLFLLLSDLFRLNVQRQKSNQIYSKHKKKSKNSDVMYIRL